MIEAKSMRVDFNQETETTTATATFTIRDQDKKGLEWADEHTAPRWPFPLSRAEIKYLRSAPSEVKAEAVFEPAPPALPPCG